MADHSKIRGQEVSFTTFDEASDSDGHAFDALRYAMQQFPLSDPPPDPDPNWTLEQQEAHRALHARPPLKFRRYFSPR